MHKFLNESFNIGKKKFANRLIQGPLAGYSAAPFRQLYYQFIPPAFCVSEMISAYDILHKHKANSRYLLRGLNEKTLSYQIAGVDPLIMATAANKLEEMGADLIDINCGCPKIKIRKKGAGSALLEDLTKLSAIVKEVRRAINIPLTVKIRIFGDDRDIQLVKALEDEGVDAIIVHGRNWQDDYDVLCNLEQIARIKAAVAIPVIANGSLSCLNTLANANDITGCDAFMIARAGCGNPWLYQQLLSPEENQIEILDETKINCFITHLEGLATLESEHKAVLQSKSLVRYYFGKSLTDQQLQDFYKLKNLKEIESYLPTIICG